MPRLACILSDVAPCMTSPEARSAQRLKQLLIDKRGLWVALRGDLAQHRHVAAPSGWPWARRVSAIESEGMHQSRKGPILHHLRTSFDHRRHERHRRRFRARAARPHLRVADRPQSAAARRDAPEPERSGARGGGHRGGSVEACGPGQARGAGRRVRDRPPDQQCRRRRVRTGARERAGGRARHRGGRRRCARRSHGSPAARDDRARQPPPSDGRSEPRRRCPIGPARRPCAPQTPATGCRRYGFW